MVGRCRHDAHGFVASPPASAALTHLINVGASNGLDRKQAAPSRNACRRADSSGKAVINMKGTLFPCLRRALCSSTPLISGIRTSVITHDDSFNWGDRKNSAADGKVWTAYPRALKRLSIAARMDASSSTTEITARLRNFGSPPGAALSERGTSTWCAVKQHLKNYTKV